MAAYDCPLGTALLPVAFFDADNTLRVARSDAVSPASAQDLYVLPFAASVIKELRATGRMIAVVSNQGGVASGYLRFDVAESALAFTASQLAQLGAKVDYFDFAEAYDEYRKPNPGTATLLDEQLTLACGRGVDWSRSLMIGDAGYKAGVDGPHPDGRPADDFSNSDRLFAEALGVPFAEPAEAFGWGDFGFYNLHESGDLLGLLAAIDGTIAALSASGEDAERRVELTEEVAGNRLVNELDP